MNALPVRPSASWRCRTLGGACWLVAWTGAALAEDGLAGRAAAALEQARPGTMAVASAPITLHTATYPSLDGAGAQWPRPGAAPGGIQYLGLTGWLTPRQASSLGLTLGMVSDGMGRSMGGVPAAYDLGVRWRSRLDQRVQLDVHAWARTPQNAAMHDAMGMIWLKEQPSFGTRLEVQWSGSRTHGLLPEFGAIGVQLEGDARLLLRAKGGGPMLYYRTKF